MRQGSDHYPYMMQVVNLNGPGTTGYSVACSELSVWAIFAHGPDEVANERPYGNMNLSQANLLWMYMPIEKGEYLTDVCRRMEDPVEEGEQFALAVRRLCCFLFTRWALTDVMEQLTTNRGRTRVFGEHGLDENISTCRLATLSGTPCRVYFGQNYEYPRLFNDTVFAFEGFEEFEGSLVTSKNSRDFPVMPTAISPCPDRGDDVCWMYTACSLDQVTGIRLCIEESKQHRSVVGMLLWYADGHRECVGQWRFDWASERVPVSETGKLYVCTHRIERGKFAGHSYVSTVAVQAPSQGKAPLADDGRWGEIPWKGSLEWWFSRSQVSVFHCAQFVRQV